MPLPKIIQSQQNALANYDYFDIAEGTGMQLFYAAATGNATTGYILTGNQVYSTSVETFHSSLDVNNFDTFVFNTPKIVGGTALVTFSICISGAYSSAFEFTTSVQKWDGSTATTLGTASTGIGSGADLSKRTYLIQIPITKTAFKAGEMLRLSLSGAVAGASYYYFGWDPMNRDGTFILPSTDNPATTTQLKVWVPFVLDL